RRMNALLELDTRSRLAVLGPGLRGPQAEALLAARGFTIGHFPQSFEYATLGGFAAARSSGQASAGYGRFDDLVLGLRVATPGGALAIVGYEGGPEDVPARRERTSHVLERQGGTLEPAAGESWERERYRGPYLRDALLEAGALVETLETVTFWSSLGELYQAV